MSSSVYTSHSYRKLRREFKARCKAHNIPCFCGQPINYNAAPNAKDSFDVDHIIPVSVRPDLAYETQNWRASHRSCNSARQDTPVSNSQWVPTNW